MTNQADRIQNAINHIKTATDIDPWAMEIAVEAMEKELKNSTQELKNPNDAISRQAAIRWVKTECNPYGKPTLDFESGKRVMEHLKTMPSVQLTYTDAEVQKIQDMEQAEIEKAFELGQESAKAEIVRCKDCRHSEHWYGDKSRCFLWHEEGIDVFEDGFCNYAERRTDGTE